MHSLDNRELKTNASIQLFGWTGQKIGQHVFNLGEKSKSLSIGHDNRLIWGVRRALVPNRPIIVFRFVFGNEVMCSHCVVQPFLEFFACFLLDVRKPRVLAGYSKKWLEIFFEGLELVSLPSASEGADPVLDDGYARLIGVVRQRVGRNCVVEVFHIE